jgi:thiol-disulfide isomerase/thioredoxin
MKFFERMTLQKIRPALLTLAVASGSYCGVSPLLFAAAEAPKKAETKKAAATEKSEEHGTPAQSGHGKEHKEGDKAKAKSKANAHGADSGKGAAGAAPTAPHEDTEWVAMPFFSATSASSENTLNFKPVHGEATVIFFLASWCIPCQQLVPDMKAIEAEFKNRDTKFYYVFTQDYKDDIRAFLGTYQMTETPDRVFHVMSNDDLQKTFHFPPVPSYYVGDRHNWMVMRALSLERSDLKKLKEYLQIHTSF